MSLKGPAKKPEATAQADAGQAPQNPGPATPPAIQLSVMGGAHASASACEAMVVEDLLGGGVAEAPAAPVTQEETSSTPPLPKVRAAKASKAAVQAPGDFSSDDPSSPNYRFRDTGYVFGSRKEMAALQIRTAAREGTRVRSADIDWASIEENPREAKALITKSHLFGKVDWDALKEGGMEPGAGFLVDRVYASVGTEPPEHTTDARKEYAYGLEVLRDRMEVCKTPDDVTKALEGLLAECEGYVLNEDEQARYDEEKGKASFWLDKQYAFKMELHRLSEPLHKLRSEISQMEWDQSKRERRKWARDPEVDARIETLRPKLEVAQKAVSDWVEAHPDAKDQPVTVRMEGGTSSTFGSTWEREGRKHRDAARVIREEAKRRNLRENPLVRGWARMGERFFGVLCYHKSSGSGAFAGHVATATAGKIKDWSWAEKTTSRVPTSSKASTQFQLLVGNHFDRTGGRASAVDSSAALKAAFGLKEVEYGLWVASDLNSAKFHTEKCAEGFYDLADLLGTHDEALSIGGRMSIGFGSRGQGAMGWRQSAPAAAWMTRNRVMNITKMSGGGSLGHEWFHGLDNMLAEVVTGKPGLETDFVSERPDLLPAGPLRQAMEGLMAAIMEGPHRQNVTVEYTGRDVLMAKSNVGRRGLGMVIADAGDAEKAVIAIRQHFSQYRDREGNLTGKAKGQLRDWTLIAAAHFGGEPEGGKIVVKAGAPTSRFAFEAANLDGGAKTPYWATKHEMAARAFQSWIEDRLEGQGRKNEYLSNFADNRFYVDPLFGPMYPYPEGEERVRINAAFDRLAAALRESGVLG